MAVRRKKIRIRKEQSSRERSVEALRLSNGPAARPDHEMLGERSDRIRLLQRTQGNAYVQRLAQNSAAIIQRRASRTVPGLPHDVVTRIETGLSDNRQGVLDTLTGTLAGRGSISLSHLTGEAMNYVDDKSGMAPGHYGHTSLSPGTGRPRPCRVDIGPDAFRSVGDLYATVMHEWQHVLQFRRPDSASEAADEMEARLWEVENMQLTGKSRNFQYLRWMRGDLRAWSARLTDVEQAAFAERIAAAQQSIEDALMRLQQGR
jgi:hypothetical protein